MPVTSSDSLTTLTDVLKALKPGPTIIEKIEIAGRHESIEELYDKIVEIARRRGEAGDPSALGGGGPG